MQRNGAGLHSASSCFWDNTTDGIHAFHIAIVLTQSVIGFVSYKNEYKDMYVITSVFGLAL
jgi:dynein light chain Tctex-type 1